MLLTFAHSSIQYKGFSSLWVFKTAMFILIKNILGLRVRFVFLLILGWIALYSGLNYYMLQQNCTEHHTVDCGREEHSGEKELSKRNIFTFDKNADCSALKPDIILYNRIFKTGSTSISNWLDSFSEDMDFYLELSTTEDWYDPLRRHIFPAIIWRHANMILSNPDVHKYVFVAHFYFGSRLKVSYKYTYINQVRDPVKRVISHFFYTHRSRDRPLRKLRKMRRSGYSNESIEECLEQQHEGCKRNVMTRFFCGRHPYCRTGSSKALERAKSNIIHYYATVGLLEHLDIYKQILHKRFPTFVPFSATQSEFKDKTNPFYDRSEVSEKTIEKIKRLNSADIKLYDFIQKRFWKQAKACGLV